MRIWKITLENAFDWLTLYVAAADPLDLSRALASLAARHTMSARDEAPHTYGVCPDDPRLCYRPIIQAEIDPERAGDPAGITDGFGGRPITVSEAAARQITIAAGTC